MYLRGYTNITGERDRCLLVSLQQGTLSFGTVIRCGRLLLIYPGNYEPV